MTKHISAFEPSADLQDIGHGVYIELRRHHETGEPEGVYYEHPCLKGEYSPAFVPLKGPRAWTLNQLEPLTISPSLLCLACKHHGFIRSGKWVPA